MDTNLRSRAIRLAAQLPVGDSRRKEILAALERMARQALAPGKTVETDHLRVHRYMDSLRVTDLTNAGRRGKVVDIMVIADLDYLNKNDIASFKFERWLGKVLDGMTFQEMDRSFISLMSELERSGAYPLPNVYRNQEKGVRIDPPESVARRVEFKVLDTTERTLSVQAKPSDVSIREVIFSVDSNTGRRGPYLHDTVVGNTKNRRETKTLYNWVVANESRLKKVRNLAEVQKMLQAEGVPYRTYYLD